MKKHVLLIAALCVLAKSYAQQIVPLILQKATNTVAPGAATTVPTDRVFIYGIGSTDFLQLEKLTASGGLSVGFKPDKNVSVFTSFNFSGAVARKTASDSVPLSSIYFPDVQSSSFALSSDIMVGPWFNRIGSDEPNNQLHVSFEGSLQERNLEKDSLIYNLSIANVNYGLKYKWYYKGRNDNICILTLGAYLNDIFINKNTKENFNVLFDPEYQPKKNSLPNQINGFSMLASVQLNNVTLYLRTYTNRHAQGDLAFSIGVKATGQFISF